jgi:hypothetical protein
VECRPGVSGRYTGCLADTHSEKMISTTTMSSKATNTQTLNLNPNRSMQG